MELFCLYVYKMYKYTYINYKHITQRYVCVYTLNNIKYE